MLSAVSITPVIDTETKEEGNEEIEVQRRSRGGGGVSKKISSITGVPANTGDFVTLVSLLFCEY
jgi:hypothetical protein